MHTWLVTIGEPLPVDGPNERLLRAGILADMLASAGHEVVWWTSTFDHVRKRHRFSTDTTLQLQKGLTLKLLHSCGYVRNVSLRRLLDHRLLARKFNIHAHGMRRPDVILCSLPPLELPATVARYGKAQGVPVIVDVRDLWPDIFLELVPAWAKPVLNPGLSLLGREARSACGDAYALPGNSSQFLDWGLKLARRTRTPLDRTFFHGYSTLAPRRSDVAAAEAFWASHGVNADGLDFVACFFGAIGPQSELETVIEAARRLARAGRKFRFVLCGRGDHLASLMRETANIPSVVFPGWVDNPKIWTLMRMSNVGLALYRSNVGYVTNLPNKPIEYLSAGLPVVSSLKGYLERFLADNGCGETYPNGDAEALARMLGRLDDNRSRLAEMSGNARRVFADKFAAKKVYGEMIAYLQEVIISFRARLHM